MLGHSETDVLVILKISFVACGILDATNWTWKEQKLTEFAFRIPRQIIL